MPKRGRLQDTCLHQRKRWGFLCKQQGDIKRARQLYEEAHEKGNTKATVNLGVLCQQQGDIKRASQLYEEAHKKGDATATSNQGILCKQQGDIKRARQLFEEACKKREVKGTVQVTIERSLLEASCPPTFNGAMPDVNAQISDTVMRTRVAEECIVVVVSKYRRAPKSFKEIFAQCSELRLRRSALEPSGSRCDLLGGFRNTVLNFFIALGRR